MPCSSIGTKAKSHADAWSSSGRDQARRLKSSTGRRVVGTPSACTDCTLAACQKEERNTTATLAQDSAVALWHQRIRSVQHQVTLVRALRPPNYPGCCQLPAAQLPPPQRHSMECRAALAADLSSCSWAIFCTAASAAAPRLPSLGGMTSPAAAASGGGLSCFPLPPPPSAASRPYVLL